MRQISLSIIFSALAAALVTVAWIGLPLVGQSVESLRQPVQMARWVTASLIAGSGGAAVAALWVTAISQRRFLRWLGGQPIVDVSAQPHQFAARTQALVSQLEGLGFSRLGVVQVFMPTYRPSPQLLMIDPPRVTVAALTPAPVDDMLSFETRFPGGALIVTRRNYGFNSRQNGYVAAQARGSVAEVLGRHRQLIQDHSAQFGQAAAIESTAHALDLERRSLPATLDLAVKALWRQGLSQMAWIFAATLAVALFVLMPPLRYHWLISSLQVGLSAAFVSIFSWFAFHSWKNLADLWLERRRTANASVNLGQPEQEGGSGS